MCTALLRGLMTSLSPSQNKVADKEQSRIKDEQVMKEYGIRLIRGFCVNDPKPVFTMGHLPF